VCGDDDPPCLCCCRRSLEEAWEELRLEQRLSDVLLVFFTHCPDWGALRRVFGVSASQCACNGTSKARILCATHPPHHRQTHRHRHAPTQQVRTSEADGSRLLQLPHLLAVLRQLPRIVRPAALGFKSRLQYDYLLATVLQEVDE
jgi:hypothetical protein